MGEAEAARRRRPGARGSHSSVFTISSGSFEVSGRNGGYNSGPLGEWSREQGGWKGRAISGHLFRGGGLP